MLKFVVSYISFTLVVTTPCSEGVSEVKINPPTKKFKEGTTINTTTSSKALIIFIQY